MGVIKLFSAGSEDVCNTSGGSIGRGPRALQYPHIGKADRPCPRALWWLPGGEGPVKGADSSQCGCMTKTLVDG